jgi:hypothetical protein
MQAVACVFAYPRFLGIVPRKWVPARRLVSVVDHERIAKRRPTTSAPRHCQCIGCDLSQALGHRDTDVQSWHCSGVYFGEACPVARWVHRKAFPAADRGWSVATCLA